VGEGGRVPRGVVFTPMDDERFVDERIRPEGMEKFDAIVFNFGVNESKAVRYAREFLNEDVGRLLAPVNVQPDYWLKQSFKVYDAKGNVLWTADDVGAWSVQFQPDGKSCLLSFVFIYYPGTINLSLTFTLQNAC